MTDKNEGLTYSDLVNFTVEDGNLYWKGRLVKTEKRLKLSIWQGIAAFLTATGIFLTGFVPLLELIFNRLNQ